MEQRIRSGRLSLGVPWEEWADLFANHRAFVYRLAVIAAGGVSCLKGDRRNIQDGGGDQEAFSDSQARKMVEIVGSNEDCGFGGVWVGRLT